MICNNNFSSCQVIGVQNQCHSTGECNHADRVTSTEETKKKHKVLLKLNLNEIPSQDGEDVIESGDTASQMSI